MKITNMQAVVFANTVSELVNKRLPVNILFALKYNMKTIGSQLQAYEEARQALNLPDDDTITPEFKKLLYETVDQSIKKIKIEELNIVDKSSDYDKFTLAELTNIEFMIEEEE